MVSCWWNTRTGDATHMHQLSRHSEYWRFTGGLWQMFRQFSLYGDDLVVLPKRINLVGGQTLHMHAPTAIAVRGSAEGNLVVNVLFTRHYLCQPNATTCPLATLTTDNVTSAQPLVAIYELTASVRVICPRIWEPRHLLMLQLRASLVNGVREARSRST